MSASILHTPSIKLPPLLQDTNGVMDLRCLSVLYPQILNLKPFLYIPSSSPPGFLCPPCPPPSQHLATLSGPHQTFSLCPFKLSQTLILPPFATPKVVPGPKRYLKVDGEKETLLLHDRLETLLKASCAPLSVSPSVSGRLSRFSTFGAVLPGSLQPYMLWAEACIRII